MTLRTIVALACTALVQTTGTVSTAQTRSGAPPHRIPRIASPPRVDGVLDEPCWSEAWTAELPFEVSPADNAPAPVRTLVMVMHDGSDLYFGMRAFDPDPSAIRAHLADRDDAWNDDWMGVVLDTFNDERRDFLLVVNPVGVQMDTIENWITGSTEWDAIWESAASIAEWGWSAELRIPFSSLRFQRSEGPQVWGFDAIRGYPRDRFRQMGAFPRDRDNDCYLCQALKIQGFEGVSPGHNLELAPTLTASRTERREDFTGPYRPAHDEVEAGVTARWDLTPNLTLGATLNPDFSQVEADARQLDVNEPFALFFPEKRPFFMEGGDFFDTLLDVVYTRVVRSPGWGVKLTGREGAHTFAGYVVDDTITNLVFPSSQGSGGTTLEGSSTAAVARYRVDFGNRFTLGLVATDREGDDYFNRVGGLDLDLRLTDSDRVQVQLLRSSTRYDGRVAQDFGQPTGEFDDLAARLYYTHTGRRLSIWAIAEDLGDGFRADLGFIPRVDTRGGQVGVSYDWIGTDDTWYSSLNLKVKLEHLDDQSGALLFEEEALQFTANGPMQSVMVVRLAGGREGFAGQLFNADTLVLKGSLKPSGNSSLQCYLRAGDRVDYANARQGRRLQLNPSFEYRIGRHLRLEGQHVWERMKAAEGRLYTANVSELAAAFHFSARSFVRAILQFVDYEYESELYTRPRPERFRHLFGQLLYSYTLNPRTVLFAGYSDNSYDQAGDGLVRADRTVFTKIGYAWML